MTLSKVFIRTPFICKLSVGICQVCYGWNFATGKIVELGESVGILAAQSIGEPGTQLTMRTFHTGGIFSGEARATLLSPFTGKIWYNLKKGGKKICTKYREKAFLTSKNKKVIIYQNNVSKSILYLPENSVIFTKPGKTIFAKQIIAELPKYKKNESELNVRFIEVRNNFTGQVYFKKKRDGIYKKTFWILSANIFTYMTFLSRIINKYYVKNVNVLLPKEQVTSYNRFNKVITKFSNISISLKNILSVSKIKFRKTNKRSINIRLVLKEDNIILTSKPSRERAVSLLNFQLKLGELFKADDMFGTVKNFYPSQVMQKRKDFILLRKISFPYSKKDSLVDMSTFPFVVKDTILSYSTYKKQKTEDIVQGLPKVEQLFEARRNIFNSRNENLHEKLANTFKYFKKKYKTKLATRKSLAIIQDSLVTRIQGIYESQGVNIADKHVEVIIKQMTSRVLVTRPGDTSFMIGDLVDINLMETINASPFRCKKVRYEPIIIGITRLSLSSQSFIAAASFQETTKVLTRAALQGRVDWLHGLKENLILGNIIPAGTGFSRTS
jgi:DNA-directed RNA polymerase subunit beta'